MLTPKYLESIGEEIGELYESVITEILADIAERISLGEDTMSATTEYLNQKLIDLGLQQQFINTKLAELTNKTDKMIEDIMEESMYKSVRASFDIYRKAGYDVSGVDFSKQLLKGTNVLKGELKNLTKTTAKFSKDTYVKAYDKAYLQVTSGAYSYDQACKNVIKDLVNDGIGRITYDSGAELTVESAVRVAVRTSVNQNALACEMEMIDQMDDANLVETSSHLGARPSHAEWQGRIFWTKKKVEGYDNFYDSTGYGTGEGLGGYNCRHSFYPYFEEFGQTYHPFDKEENDELYELSQKQRYHERKTREWDRRYQIEKAGGQDTKTSQQYRNYHKSKLNEIVKESKGKLKRDYSAEKGYVSSNNKLKTPSMGKFSEKKVRITDDAIKKVKEVNFSGLSDSLKLQKLHKELLTIAKDRNNSNEVLGIVDVSLSKAPIYTLGDERFVNPNNNEDALLIMAKAKYQSVYWIHNHGFTSDFSYADLGCFADERVKAMTIATNKGKISVINKSEKYDVVKFIEIVKDEKNKYEDHMKHLDEIAINVLKKHNECGIEYIR